MRSSWRWAGRIFTFVLGLAPCGAMAVDGVVEINQASVDAAGGFPFEISKFGSYRLTSNLVVTTNTSAIRFVNGSAGSTLDLNGFVIQGVNNCKLVDFDTACDLTNGGDGVIATSDATGVSVLNGMVRGMGRVGVNLQGRRGRIIGVHTTMNGLSGIGGSVNILIDGCRSTFNGGDGITASDGSIVSGNVVARNGGSGIDAQGSTVVSENAVTQNDGIGIEAADLSSISGNLVKDNDGIGLSLSNSQGGGTGYRDNVINSNGGGTVSGGINLGGNVCNQFDDLSLAGTEAARWSASFYSPFFWRFPRSSGPRVAPWMASTRSTRPRLLRAV